MAQASSTVGEFTLTGTTLANGQIGYALKSPDGSSFLGPGPLTLGTRSGTPIDSAGKPMIGYKYYTLGNDQYILLTEAQGATLAAALPQMITSVNSQIASQQTTAAPAPKPAPAPTTIATPTTTTAPTTAAKPAGNVTVATTSSNTKVSTATTANTANAKTSGEIVVNAYDTNRKPANTAPYAVLKTDDIIINSEPLVLPDYDLKTGKAKGNITIQTAPIKIPGETIYSNGASVTNTSEVKPDTGPAAPSAPPVAQGLSGKIQSAASAATAQDQAQFEAREDWRVRLALAPDANYLYKAKPPGILQPLTETDGVIFPYTPSLTVNYAANYEGTSMTHTNYKVYQYQNSSVDQVQITCEFTAQDVKEANYILAVIHFFRSMTKMFYGQDSSPKNGTPPPLCYIFGMGGYQFDALPLAISGFNYSLPQDVDYIKTTGASAAGTPQPSIDTGATNPGRLGAGVAAGGVAPPPDYGTTPTQSGEPATWVPTKIQLSITCLPVLSRNAVSNRFSLKDYATGKLLNGTRQGTTGGGMW